VLACVRRDGFGRDDEGTVGAALPILSVLIWLALNRELHGAIARSEQCRAIAYHAHRGSVVCSDDYT